MSDNINAPNLVAKFVIDNTDLDKGLGYAQRSISSVQGILSDFQEDINRVANAALALGTSLGVGLGIGINNAVRLEQALARTFSVGEQTAAAMALLEGSVKELGQGVVGANQLANGLYNLASAGLDVNEQLDVLPVTMRLAVASAVELDTASQLVVQTMRAFNLEAADAARIGNVVAASNATSSSNALRLAEAYRAVAANASSAGLTLEETTTALNVLIDVFQNGEQAGTGLRNVITRLSAGGTELRDFARQAGVSLSDLNPSVVGLEAAIGNLVRVLEVDLSAAYQIFGDRGQTAANILASNAERFREMEEAITGTNELAKQFDLQSQTTAARLTALRNTVSVVVQSYSQGLVPILGVASDALRGFTELVGAVPQPLKSLIGILSTLSVGFLVLGGLMAKVLMMFIRKEVVTRVLLAAQAKLLIVNAGLVKANTAATAAVRAYTGAQKASAVVQAQVAASQALYTQAVLQGASAQVQAQRLAELHALQAAARVVAANEAMAASYARTAVAAQAWGTVKAGAARAVKEVTDLVVISLRRMGAAMLAIVRNPIVWAILAILVALREMGKHWRIVAIGVQEVNAAFREIGEALGFVGSLVQWVSNIVATFALSVVIPLAHALNGAALAMRELVATGELWATILKPMAWITGEAQQAIEDWREEMDAARESWNETRDEIRDAGDTAFDRVWGLATDRASEMASALGMTVDEFEKAEKALRDFVTEARESADDIVFNVDATPLERSLRSVDENVRAEIAKLDEFLEDNPLIVRFDLDGNLVEDIADSVYGNLLDNIEERGEEAKRILAQTFVGELQRRLDGDLANAISDGSARILAEYRLREREIDDQLNEARRSLATQLGALAQAEAVFYRQRILNRERRDRELRELDEAQERQVVEFETRVAQARVEAMEDGEAKIRAQTQLALNQLEADTRAKLEAVQGNSAAVDAILAANDELTTIYLDGMTKSIEDFNRAVLAKIQESTDAFTLLQRDLERRIATLTSEASGDPFEALMRRQVDATLNLRDQMRDAILDISKAFDDGLISRETALERMADVTELYGRIEALNMQQQVDEQADFFQDLEAEARRFERDIAGIYADIAELELTGDLDLARARRDRELSDLRAWHQEQLDDQRLTDEERLNATREFEARKALINATFRRDERQAHEAQEAAERRAHEAQEAQVVQFETRVAQARVQAMEDGEAKIRAQTQLALNQLERDTREKLEAVEGNEEAVEGILASSAELTEIYLDGMTKSIEDFNKAVLARVKQSSDAFDQLQRDLGRRIATLTAEASGDPFEALMQRQIDATQTLRDQMRDAILDISQAFDDGLISRETALERMADVTELYGRIEALKMQRQVDEQADFFRDLEAEARRFERDIAGIYAAIAELEITGDLDRARARRDRELDELRDWYQTQLDDQRLTDEERLRAMREYEARRALIDATFRRAERRAHEEAVNDRVRAEIEAARRLSQDGIAGQIRAADLRLGIERLRVMRAEFERLGASAESIAALNAAIGDMASQLADLQRSGLELLATTLEEVGEATREIVEDLFFTDEQRARAQTRRNIAALEAERDARIAILRDQIEGVAAFHAAEAALVEAYAGLIARVRQQADRDAARREEERLKRVLDLERTIINETARLRAQLGGDEAAIAQTNLRLQAEEARRAFLQQLDELRANEDERLSLIADFQARERLQAELHQRELARIARERVVDTFSGFREIEDVAERQRSQARQAAARENVTAMQAEIQSQRELQEVTRESIQTTKDEIAELRRRNDELRASISAVSTVRSYYEQVRELFDAQNVFQSGDDPRDELARLTQQRRIAEDLYHQAVRSNLPLQDRAALLRDLVDLNRQVVDLGGEALRSDIRLVWQARDEYRDTVATARDAAAELEANERAIDGLDEELTGFEASAKDLDLTLKELTKELEKLNAAMQGQVWVDAEERFLDVVEAAELARDRYHDALIDTFEDLNPAIGVQARSLADRFLDLLEQGEVERAFSMLGRQLGAELPAGVIEGMLATPMPGTGETLAEMLGLDEEGIREFGERFGAAADDIELLPALTPKPQERDEFDEEVEDILNELAKDLDEGVDDAGGTAGKGLMAAFANGITSNRATLLNAVDSVLQDVRNRLPSSDAKFGPLSDLTSSGRALVRTFVGGAESEGGYLARHMEGLFGAARPGGAPAGVRYGMPGAAGGPLIGTMNVDGRQTQPSGIMDLTARSFVDSVRREVNAQHRMR